LLAFALWTLALLFCTVGYYRWSRILTERQAISTFGPDGAGGPDWYRRALRAHANCIENLPVFGAIVLAAAASGFHSAAFDAMALSVPVARVGQSLVHVAAKPTNAATSVRFAFFFVQIVAMVAMTVWMLLW
jgi:uncharacterized MAPEG superfamily protein